MLLAPGSPELDWLGNICYIGRKSVSFLISCQASRMRCAWWCRGSATGSFPHPVTCLCAPHPLPTPLYYSTPLPTSLTYTHSLAVIREQGSYKRASWEPGLNPSVQWLTNFSNAGGRSWARGGRWEGGLTCRSNFLLPRPLCLDLPPDHFVLVHSALKENPLAYS